LLLDISRSILKVLNNFEIAIPLGHKPEPTASPLLLRLANTEPLYPATLPVPAPPAITAPTTPLLVPQTPAPTILKTPELTIAAILITPLVQMPVPLVPIVKPALYFLRKRWHSTIDNPDKPPWKILREILALLTIEELTPKETAYTATVAVLIPIPKSYTTAINNLIYGEQ
jgi:hypothetical protein